MPVCMLCSESKDSRHLVRIFSKAGGDLKGCPSFRHSQPPSLIYQFMLNYFIIYYFYLFYWACDRPMPGPFPAIPVFLGKKPWKRVWLTHLKTCNQYWSMITLKVASNRQIFPFFPNGACSEEIERARCFATVVVFSLEASCTV